MDLTKDYFKAFTKKEIYELPYEIEVTVIDSGWSDATYIRKIKFVWENGLGYARRTKDGCTYCSMITGNKVILPNGTTFRYNKGTTNLIDMVLKACGPELKLAESDEVEFMDI